MSKHSDFHTMFFLAIIWLAVLASSPAYCWSDARFSLVRQLSAKHYQDGYKVLGNGEDLIKPDLRSQSRSSRPLFSWDFITPAPASLKAFEPDASDLPTNISSFHPSTGSAKKVKHKKNKNKRKYSGRKNTRKLLNNQTNISGVDDMGFIRESDGFLHEKHLLGIERRGSVDKMKESLRLKKERRRKNKHKKDRTGKKNNKSERRKADRHRKKEDRKLRRKGKKQQKDNILVSNSFPGHEKVHRHNKPDNNLEVISPFLLEHNTIPKNEIKIDTSSTTENLMSKEAKLVSSENKLMNNLNNVKVSKIPDSFETSRINDNILLPILFSANSDGSKYPEMKSVNLTYQNNELKLNTSANEGVVEHINSNVTKHNKTNTEELINNSLPNELDANVPYRESYQPTNVISTPSHGNITLEAFNELNYSSKSKDHSQDNHAFSFGENSQKQNSTGDLTCLTGTFLPAPTVPGAAIKYIRTQTLNQLQTTVYLIAEYECQSQYHLKDPNIYQLVCSQRRWHGTEPSCLPDHEVNHIPRKECGECDHICQIVSGTKICSCYKGFRLEDNICKDINECEYSNGGCESGCRNTLGSYHCICPPGLRLADDGKSCIDINECLLRNGHGPCQDTCLNLWGGYECSCEHIAGTKLAADNHTCEDVDECADGSAGCSHTCLNTLGSAFCLCPSGFMLGDDWKTCQDINECVYEDLQTEHCRLGCVNTIGSYHCLEEEEDSMTLQQTATELPVICPEGMRVGLHGNCEDIDECEEKLSGCTQSCLNTNGSFQCICGLGFSLSSDNKTCTEGAEEAVCPPLDSPIHGYLECARHLVRMRKSRFPWMKRARVVNHAGSVCQLKCPHGYILEGEYRKTCGQNKKWTGPDNGTCVPLPAPSIRCPSNMTVSTKPGKSTAYVTIPQPVANVNWFRYVDANPAWGKSLEANLPVGHWEVKFTARHPTSHLTASCILTISVMLENQ